MSTGMSLTWHGFQVRGRDEGIVSERALCDVRSSYGVRQADAVEQPVEELRHVIAAMVGPQGRADLRLLRHVLALRGQVEGVHELLRVPFGFEERHQHAVRAGVGSCVDELKGRRVDRIKCCGIALG